MGHERQDIPRHSNSSRTRTGYQHSQSSLWSLEELGGNSVAPGGAPVPVISAEQSAERDRKVILRRQSAKHKSEMEKLATVEKLLRVSFFQIVLSL